MTDVVPGMTLRERRRALHFAAAELLKQADQLEESLPLRDGYVRLLDREGIKQIIPHRYAALLLRDVIGNGNQTWARMCLEAEDVRLLGHFESVPVVAEHYIEEAAKLAGGVLWILTFPEPKQVLAASALGGQITPIRTQEGPIKPDEEIWFCIGQIDQGADADNKPLTWARSRQGRLTGRIDISRGGPENELCQYTTSGKFVWQSLSPDLMKPRE